MQLLGKTLTGIKPIGYGFFSDESTKNPVNIVAGPLGVGKTTTINHLLKQRPENEHWAILVNEYGLVGLDAALMEKDPLVKDSPV